ncbi:hypothetical protein TI39_contig468g00019 [Zymoseptoria brevis]|uniref:DUF7730 domain-containing protein n=1 Tax=Zymoseptoria brevis TaxID=1047168 RepID=A0A0F4GNF7_9PEZI|nr:hypothetical protein TI39_contig468g00019 [Zymoseptoria brevis]
MTEINPQTESPLFKIPAELRLRIYELVLSVDPPGISAGITLRKDTMVDAPDQIASSQTQHPKFERYMFDGEVKPSVLSLLQTCRWINREAESIFYEINKFQMMSPEHFEDIAKDVGIEHRVSQIRSITLMHTDDCRSRYNTDYLPNLKTFRLQLDIHDHVVKWWDVTKPCVREILGELPLETQVDLVPVMKWHRLVHRRRIDLGQEAYGIKMVGEFAEEAQNLMKARLEKGCKQAPAGPDGQSTPGWHFAMLVLSAMPPRPILRRLEMIPFFGFEAYCKSSSQW